MSIRDIIRETLVKAGYPGRKLVCWILYRETRQVHPRSEVYTVSYPRSGATWLKVLLAKAVALHFDLDQGGENNPLGVFDKGYIGSDHPEAPWIISSHTTSDCAFTVEESRRNQNYDRYRNKKIILLVRDPRDVIVSYYFYRTRRAGETHNLSSFIRHPWWGVDRLIAFMADWYNHRKIPADIILIRYEDMRQDTEHTLRQIMNFMGLESTDAVLREAVAFASFENMKKLEKKDPYQTKSVAKINPNDPESPKARRGKVGGYADYLSAKDVAYIEDKMVQSLPAELGYTPSRIVQNEPH